MSLFREHSWTYTTCICRKHIFRHRPARPSAMDTISTSQHSSTDSASCVQSVSQKSLSLETMHSSLFTTSRWKNCHQDRAIGCLSVTSHCHDTSRSRSLDIKTKCPFKVAVLKLLQCIPRHHSTIFIVLESCVLIQTDDPQLFKFVPVLLLNYRRLHRRCVESHQASKHLN